ncbi:MAG: accessory factor UbiK family protein [Alphaproteobacteria bacterium]
MQINNRLVDDIARLAAGAAGVAASMREEVEVLVRQRLERLLAGMEIVSREDFDAVRAMAAKARDEQDALSERIARLEQRLADMAEKAAPAVGDEEPII